MRAMGIMIRIPKQVLLPSVLVVTLLAIYAQESRFEVMLFALGFGFLGYLFRRLDVSVLPFVIAFILAGTLERTVRQAFAATGGDPYFLFSSWISSAFMLMAVAVVLIVSYRRKKEAT